MQSFRSMEDVQKARLPPKIRQAVERAVSALLISYGDNYTPDDCGYVVLVDRTTTDQHAIELFGRPWHDARLEGVTYERDSGTFFTCVLCNNQFGYSIIVPDLPWLDPRFLATLMDELGGDHGA